LQAEHLPVELQSRMVDQLDLSRRRTIYGLDGGEGKLILYLTPPRTP
jgi:hypothetical protein